MQQRATRAHVWLHIQPSLLGLLVLVWWRRPAEKPARSQGTNLRPTNEHSSLSALNDEPPPALGNPAGPRRARATEQGPIYSICDLNCV